MELPSAHFVEIEDVIHAIFWFRQFNIFGAFVCCVDMYNYKPSYTYWFIKPFVNLLFHNSV